MKRITVRMSEKTFDIVTENLINEVALLSYEMRNAEISPAEYNRIREMRDAYQEALKDIEDNNVI